MAETMTLKRAKELINILIDDLSGVPGPSISMGGEPFSVEETINYLFTLDFTEEELIELGYSETDIDSANEKLMSNTEM